MALIVRHWRVNEVVERDELVDIRPDILIARVKDMRAVLVDVDALPLFTVDIAAHMIATFQHQHRLPCPLRLMSKNGTK